MESHAIFQNTDPIVFVLFISFFFDLLYQGGYRRQYFWTLNLKVLAYEADTAWNRGIPYKILTFLIKLYLVLLNGSKSWSEVWYFEIKWICRPIRQKQPETGEYLVFSSKYQPYSICYVHYFILWLIVSMSKEMNVTNLIGLVFWKKYKGFPCFGLYLPFRPAYSFNLKRSHLW